MLSCFKKRSSYKSGQVLIYLRITIDGWVQSTVGSDVTESHDYLSAAKEPHVKVVFLQSRKNS